MDPTLISHFGEGIPHFRMVEMWNWVERVKGRGMGQSSIPRLFTAVRLRT